MLDILDNLAIRNFREYLRIPSVQPNVNYDDCVAFIRKQAKSLHLPVRVYNLFPGKPVVVITWLGRDPKLPSILLNGHMDVVPVYEEDWKYPPFDAKIDEKGNIYGRGSQDMKCNSIQYLEAIRRMRRDGVTLKRTVHLLFVPDEEIGGEQGMKAFVKSKHFKALNVGFALDEGMPNPGNAIPVVYGEKTRWGIRVHFPGDTAHASLLIDDTPGEKVSIFLEKVYEFRAEEEAKWDGDPVNFGDATSINLTIMEGGVESNVIPEKLDLTFDCRIAPSMDVVEFENRLLSWCKEAGEDVTIEYIQKDDPVTPTKVDETNPYWVAFKKAAEEINVPVQPVILPAVTDNRFIRAEGIPAFGFSPMPNTPVLAHDNNEYLNKDVFLRGIKIYRKLITAVANLGEQ